MDIDNLQTLINHLGATDALVEIDGTPCLVIPAGHKLVELAHLREAPHHAKAAVTAETANDFLTYYNAHADEDSTVFFSLETGNAVGIINYHPGHGYADWCDHRVHYHCPITPEWAEWTAANGKKFTQSGFAEFIEDHQPDIITPDGATMLEIARSLQATTGVTFRSARNLHNGEAQLEYTEQIDGRAGRNGQLSIPETITLHLTPYRGGATYEFAARFRYRIQDGELSLLYQLLRHEQVLEEAMAAIAAEIAAGMKTGTFLHGTP